eukprot:596693-Pyramimonas_sp.AAC.1
MVTTIQLAQQKNGGGAWPRWHSQSSHRRVPCPIGSVIPWYLHCVRGATRRSRLRQCALFKSYRIVR